MRKLMIMTAFVLGAVACGDDYQPSERVFAGTQPGEDIFNCTQVCDNYQDCQDEDFDRSSCVSACEDRADYDDAFQAALDRCEACLDEGSCAEQEDRCASDCDDVINGSA
jgi:hypothetical protein